MPRYRRVQAISHDVGPEGRLVLVVTSADVRLAAADGSIAELQATFEVTAANEAEADARFEAGKLRVAASDGRLEATEDGTGRGIGSAFERLLGGHDVDLERVEGSAPRRGRLDVRAVSGDLQTTGFLGGQRLETVSGDLRIAESGGHLEVHSVSGDISLRAVADVDLDVETVSGDLSAEAPSFRRLDVNAVSGDISVDGGLAVGPHAIDTVSGDVRLATSSGVTVLVRGLASDVHSSLPHRIEGSADRRQLIVGDGAASLAVNSMSGDLLVTQSRQKTAPPIPAPVATPQTDDPRTAILTALERGEIDVDEAMRRLGGDA